MSSRRVIAIVFTSVNALCAVVTATVALSLVLRTKDVSEPPRSAGPKPVTLPAARDAGFEPLELDARAPNPPPPLVGTSATEDALVLRDALSEFSREWKVIFASADGEPKNRMCVLASDYWGQQQALAPGERVGRYVLLAIEPRPGPSRSVLLRFRETHRGEEVEVILRANP